MRPFTRKPKQELEKRPKFLSMIDRTSFLDGYPFLGDFAGLFAGSLVGNREQIGQEFLQYVMRAYRANPIIYALALNRYQLFSEARFQFREHVNGRPGRVFGTADLAPLEHPWPGGSTRDLLAMAEVHNTCAGNFFAARLGDQIRVMRPDWTWIVLGTPNDDPNVGPLDLEAEVIGYLYARPGGDARTLLPENVIHYKPSPDPLLPYRGLSWLTPCIEELLADKAMTTHRKKYMEGGAHPNLVVKLNIDDAQEFDEWVSKYAEQREEAGIDVNPYRTLFLAAAADPVPIGAHLKDLDFTNVQSAGEVRMAAAAGVHPAVAALFAGLQGSALNAGNFESAFRAFINQTIRPLWGSAEDAFSRVINIPGSAEGGVVELWADDRDIPALQEDAKKASDITAQDAATLATLVMNGWDPDAAVEYVQTRDPARLTGSHSGLPSVQLQPAANGNGGSRQRALPAG